jgi:NIMA-interacting peptidyl-prolyl cis-trans isomerase 1
MSRTHQKPYFYNKSSNTSSWVAPSGLSPREIDALPGAECLKVEREDSGGGGEASKVFASHLLIKHRGSRNPKSWKVGGITLSPV